MAQTVIKVRSISPDGTVHFEDGSEMQMAKLSTSGALGVVEKTHADLMSGIDQAKPSQQAIDAETQRALSQLDQRPG